VVERVYPATAPALIGRGLVASSFQYYLSGDEHLRVLARNASGVAWPLDVQWRFWREADRVIQLTDTAHATDPTGTESSEDFALDAGALIGLRVGFSRTGLRFGLVWVRVQLIRGLGPGARVIGTLLQGYVSAHNDLAWPGSPLETMHEGHGATVQKAWTLIGAPLAAEVIVPSDRRWRLMAARLEVTTGAVVANRFVEAVVIGDSGVELWRAPAPVVQTAGNTFSYSGGFGVQPSALTGNSRYLLGWPIDLELTSSQAIRVDVNNAQAGDSISGLGALLVRQWFDD